MDTTKPNTCKYCRHWHWWQENDKRNKTHSHKPCMILNDITFEGLDSAYATQCEDSTIYTGPDFGCIHFQL
jgi:hypothetical protein